MNLHGIVRGAIQVVNPDIAGTVRASLGNITQPDGSRTPAYTNPIPVQLQVQALTTGDLALTENAEQQALMQSVYLYGQLQGISRAGLLGGDLLTFQRKNDPTALVWLVTMVAESWPDWCRVIVTQQVDPAT